MIAARRVPLGAGATSRTLKTCGGYARVTDGLMCAEAVEVQSWIQMTVLENFDSELGIDRGDEG